MIGYFIGGPLDGEVQELADHTTVYTALITTGPRTAGDPDALIYDRAEQRIEGDDEAYYFRLRGE